MNLRAQILDGIGNMARTCANYLCENYSKTEKSKKQYIGSELITNIKVSKHITRLKYDNQSDEGGNRAREKTQRAKTT